jgi:26S proteasome non-ATPase regulatory subunit 9
VSCESVCPARRLLTVAVRTTRARIIYLRNDYKELMGVIEKHLHDHFASLEDDADVPAPTFDASQLRDSVPEQLDQPFAKVNSVVDNSPAETAGLRAGDLIRNFGYVNRNNHDNLRKVAECVQGNEGVSFFSFRQRPLKDSSGPSASCRQLTNSQQNILVKISRNVAGGQTQELRLTLVPRRDWGGRGLLGCHILPL